MVARPLLLRAIALFSGAFALYALTAQRGLGWGDSGEFQYRVLTLGWEGLLKGCDSFATAHPLYIALCKLVCSTPFQVTLVSAFFGALAVALFYLLARNFALAALLALSHGLWWLSTVSEVYTLSLAFFAAELLALRRFRETGGAGALGALAALNGLHLEVHNLALLALPVYVWVVLPRRRGVLAAFLPRRRGVLAASLWLGCASFWLWSFFALGPREVLFGRYGAKVSGVLPANCLETGFNFVLMALSLAVPFAIGLLRADARQGMRDKALVALFSIHFLFFVRYFVPDQFTFALPSLVLAFLLVSSVALSRRTVFALAAVQLLLPLAAWGLFALLPHPDRSSVHPGRDDASYFALPWHFTDDSASRAAAVRRQPWQGYL